MRHQYESSIYVRTSCYNAAEMHMNAFISISYFLILILTACLLKLPILFPSLVQLTFQSNLPVNVLNPYKNPVCFPFRS